MALNWKQNIGKGNLTSEEGKKLLSNFRYPTEIDKKGRLLIDAGMSKFVIAFKENGDDSTLIGVSHFKMKAGAVILVFILLCAAVIPGLVVVGVINKKRKEVFFEAVRLMNQNLDKLGISIAQEDPAEKLKKLNEMLENKLISQEDYDTKKREIIAEY